MSEYNLKRKASQENIHLISITRIPKLKDYDDTTSTSNIVDSNQKGNNTDKPTTYVYYTNPYEYNTKSGSSTNESNNNDKNGNNSDSNVDTELNTENEINIQNSGHRYIYSDNGRSINSSNNVMIPGMNGNINGGGILTDESYFKEYENTLKKHYFVCSLIIFTQKILISGINIFTIIIMYDWIDDDKYKCNNNILSLYNWWYLCIILLILHYILFIYISINWRYCIRNPSAKLCTKCILIIFIFIYIGTFYYDSIGMTFLNIIINDNNIFNIIKQFRYIIRGSQCILYPTFIILYPRLKCNFICCYITITIFIIALFVVIDYILPIINEKNICIFSQT